MSEAALARTGVVAEPMLAVEELHAWYGESHILHGISFHINPGEVVTLLGRNGAGKTTTLSRSWVWCRAGAARSGSGGLS